MAANEADLFLSESDVRAYPLDKYGRAFPFVQGPELTHDIHL